MAAGELVLVDQLGRGIGRPSIAKSRSPQWWRGSTWSTCYG